MSTSQGGLRKDKNWRKGTTLGKANIKQIKNKSNEPSKALAWSSREGAATKEGPAKDGGRAGPSKKRVREEKVETDQDEEVEKDVDAAVESDEEDQEPTAVQPAKKGKRQNRKTGGTGKKQKVFVEEKSDMLSLAASITGQVEQKSKAKLEKVKQHPAPPTKDPKQPSKAKQQQMDAARNVVAQRSKQKKDDKRADLAPPPPKIDDGKKRVSFA